MVVRPMHEKLAHVAIIVAAAVLLLQWLAPMYHLWLHATMGG